MSITYVAMATVVPLDYQLPLKLCENKDIDIRMSCISDVMLKMHYLYKFKRSYL